MFSVVLADNLLTWGPAAWGFILGLIATPFILFFGVVEEIMNFFSGRKDKKQRIKSASEKEGKEAADAEVLRQHDEAAAFRKHVKDAVVEGVTGSEKSDQIKFKVFVAVIAVLAVLAIVQSG
jgi:hypothetical protein